MDTARIRAFNDAFRASLSGGRVFITPGVSGLPMLQRLVEKVRTFDTFDENNDPHSEHDFGALDHEGERIFWKIDYYDCEMQSGVPIRPTPRSRLGC